MIILSDCFSKKIDEGCIKVANSLSKRMKNNNSDVFLISCGKDKSFADEHLKLNKLFLNKDLFKYVRERKQDVLYIPFASNTLGSILRTFILSLVCRKKVYVLFALRYSMSKLAEMILKMSKAEILLLSKDSYEHMYTLFGNKAHYIKTGVDIQKFVPVTAEQKKLLREKYGLGSEDKVLLHVGHMKKGRNVDKLLQVDDTYKVLLVVSSVTEAENDLKIRMLQKENITVIDSYLENIEEIYQVADGYLFLVEKEENCIDVPLSILEAMACNLPVVTTKYGEVKSLKEGNGIYFLNKVDKAELNEQIEQCLQIKNYENRKIVEEYDWSRTISDIKKMMN